MPEATNAVRLDEPTPVGGSEIVGGTVVSVSADDTHEREPDAPFVASEAEIDVDAIESFTITMADEPEAATQDSAPIDAATIEEIASTPESDESLLTPTTLVLESVAEMTTEEAVAEWSGETTRVRPTELPPDEETSASIGDPVLSDAAAEVRAAHEHDGEVVRAEHSLGGGDTMAAAGSHGSEADAHDRDTTVDRPVPTELLAARTTLGRTPTQAEAAAGADVAAAPMPVDRPRPVLGAQPSSLTEEGSRDWAGSYEVFRSRVQQLARAGRWRDIAAITSWAATHASWGTGTTLSTLLLDLARLYRDRLDDAPLAEEAFAALAMEEAANSEALEYLMDTYERRGDSRAVYDLLLRAVEATWDPGERLAWTQRCAEIAQSKLDDESLAIRAWAQLWRLGDASEEAARSLSQLYRSTQRWTDLARFLRERADRAEGAERIMVLRQLAEVQMVAVRDAAAAAATLREVLHDRPSDRPTRAILARLLARSGAFDELARMADDSEIAGFVADALWDAGRHTDAAAIYTRNLDRVEDRERAELRIREQLARSGQHEALVRALTDAAAGAPADRAVPLLDEAAEVAESRLGDARHALELLERKLVLRAPTVADWERVARLAEATGDAQRTAAALDALIAAAGSPQARVDSLRRLARLSAGPLSDDARAERCWRELVGIDPSDTEARDELVALHRRRGNFEALHSALMRQLTLARDPDRAESIARRIAENADANFADAQRRLEATQRVLDYAPDDLAAWRGLEQLRGSLDHVDSRIGALERLAVLVDSKVDRIACFAAIGDAHRKAGRTRAALTAFERVLHLEPSHPASLDAVGALYVELIDPVAAQAALEAAAAYDRDVRADLLARKRDLATAEHDRNAETCRIALITGDIDGAIAALESSADRRIAASFVSTLLRLSVALASDAPSRRARVERLAAHLAAHGSEREAFALAAASTSTLDAGDNELASLRKLAGPAARHEDLAVIIEQIASRDAANRSGLALEAAQIWSGAMQDPTRAIAGLRAIVDAHGATTDLLDALESFATNDERLREVDDVLIAQLDRTAEPSARSALAARRRRLLERLGDATRSRLSEVVAYRRGENGELQSGDIDGLLPVARLLARSDAPSHSLLEAANALGTGSDLRALAFDITREALIRDPASSATAAALEGLGEKLGRDGEVVDALRVAAARCTDGTARAALLMRATARPGIDPATREELFRRLLDVEPRNTEALEFLVSRHRDRHEWRDLRDRLGALAAATGDAARRHAALREIGIVSDSRLDDTPAAIAAWRAVLAEAPTDAESYDLLVAMVERRKDPALQLELRRAELDAATGERLETLARQVAELERELGGDEDAARRTLIAAYDRLGAGSGLFADVVAALEASGDSASLVTRLLERAEVVTEPQERAQLVERALRTAERAGNTVAEEIRGTALERCVAANPDNPAVLRRYAAYLRRAGRFDDLLGVLDRLSNHGTRIEQLLWQSEKARILGSRPETRADASQVWKSIAHDHFAMPIGPLALAAEALAGGDLAAYIGHRREQAARLAPVDAALVLCHLAEVCDEHPEFGIDVAEIYREARKLDPQNEPAQEALRAIGRRLRTIRPAAALLPEEGEREMTWGQRAVRLVELAEGALFSDAAAALHWGRRATAIAPDHVAAWEITAIAAERLADRRTAETARMGAYGAFLRSTAPSVDSLVREAEFAYRAAQAEQAVGNGEVAAALTVVAHELRPEHAASAAAVARLFIDTDRFDEAERVLDVVVAASPANTSLPAEIAHLRGVLAERRGDLAQARAHYAAALEARPLYAAALLDRAALDASSGLTAAAVESLTRALVSTTDDAMRATIYYRLGALLDDRLGSHDEAAACYAAALRCGSTERDLQLRVLRADRRAGRNDRALQVIDRLLASTTDAGELAQLWLDRGLTWLAMGDQDDNAVEAFDMALSYDAGCNGAREGLAAVFERRGDWVQYVQIVEAMTDGGSATSRAAALLRLARVYRERLRDDRRAEEYLRRSVAIEPSLAAVSELDTYVARRDPLGAERQELLARRAALGPPWYAPMLALGELLLDREPRRAWCLLAPVLMIRGVDDAVKSRIRDMRRDHERTALLAPSRDARAVLLATLPATRRAIAEAFAASPPPQDDLAGVVEISAMSSNGRIFQQLAEAAGANAVLARADEQAVACRFVRRGAQVVTVVRSDVLQQAARAELGWLLGMLAAQTAREMLPFASLPTGELGPLVAALSGPEAPAGVSEASAEAARAELAAWDGDAVSVLREETIRAARTLGLVAGADIYQVFRILGRLEPGLERPGVYATVEQFDEYVGSSPLLRDMLLTAGSPTFGELMRASREIAW